MSVDFDTGLKTDDIIRNVSGPLILMTAIAPPMPVAGAAIVVSCLMVIISFLLDSALWEMG